MNHPLHISVAQEVRKRLDIKNFELLFDPACDDKEHHQLPLFIGGTKARETRMCCVDILVMQDRKVRAIVEIEESGFHPTKICGKFFQAVLANYYIHDSHLNERIPFADKVIFFQVLDRSKFPEPVSKKGIQAEIIEKEINRTLPLRQIKEYRLFLIGGQNDHEGLFSFGDIISEIFTA